MVAAFGFALNGIAWMWRTQPHLRVHAVITVVVLITARIVACERDEWCLLGLAIGLVLAAEALNSALEALADAVHPEEHPLVGHAKDAAAAGVLMAAIAAGAVGLAVLWPRIMLFFTAP